MFYPQHDSNHNNAGGVWARQLEGARQAQRKQACALRICPAERKIIAVYEEKSKLLRTSVTLPMTMSPRAAEYLACNQS